MRAVSALPGNSLKVPKIRRVDDVVYYRGVPAGGGIFQNASQTEI